MRSPKNSDRVAIIGCRNFNAANLYSLLAGGAVKELVLLGEDCERLIDAVEHWQKSFPMAHPARIFAGDYQDAAKAEIVVIAAGAESGADDSELDLLGRNIDLTRKIIRQLKENNFVGVILITTNPVDILARVALEESDLTAGYVIGSGIVLDTERFRKILGGRTECESCSFVKAEPGEIATWCAARSGRQPIIDFCQPNCPEFDNMLETVRRNRTEITRSKPHPPLAVGSCVTRICEAILRDERTILPVTAMAAGHYGISGVYLNLPCVIRRSGVEEILKPQLTDSEIFDLKESADILKQTLEIFEQKVLTVKKT